MWCRDHRVPGLLGNRSYMRKTCPVSSSHCGKLGENIFAMLCHVPWDHLFKIYSYFLGKEALPFCLHVMSVFCILQVYNACGGQKGAMDHLGLDLQVAVRLPCGC